MSIKTEWVAGDIKQRNKRYSLPTVYRHIRSHKFRFQVDLDSNYLEQSNARVEIWCPATMTWNFFLNFNISDHFTIKSGPSTYNGLRSDSPELISPLSQKFGPDQLASSYNKILYRMADETKTLIDFVDY